MAALDEARHGTAPGRFVLTLLLDLDGTLTDSREGILRSLAHSLRAMDVPPPDDATLTGWIGAPIADVYRALLPDPTEARVAAGIAHYRARYDDVGWRENRVYPGVPEFLAALRPRGFRVVLATAKLQVSAIRIAQHFEFSSALDAIYGAEPGGARSHKPDLIEYIVARERLSPARAVMLGDRHHDVSGARAHGLRSLGITYGYGDRAELVAAGATWVCDDLEEALAVLDAAVA
jgi:phosphoglycolate phosphatase